jgi:hypothetical protein
MTEAHTRKAKIEDGMILRSIEKRKERINKNSLRILSETVGLRFGATTPNPDSRPVAFWLISGIRLRAFGEKFSIAGTVLGIALESLGKGHQNNEVNPKAKDIRH